MANKIKTIKTDVTIKQYTRKLKASGFKQIGMGCFATVYLHPGKNRVYKVGKLDCDDAGEWAYLSFVKKVLRNNNNPWFPKIYSVKIFKTKASKDHYAHFDENEMFFVVSMERLNEIKGSDDKSEMLEKLIQFHTVFGSIFKGTMPDKNIKHFVGAMRVLNSLERNGHELDIHNANIMTRKNGQVVITDPVC